MVPVVHTHLYLIAGTEKSRATHQVVCIPGVSHFILTSFLAECRIGVCVVVVGVHCTVSGIYVLPIYLVCSP